MKHLKSRAFVANNNSVISSIYLSTTNTLSYIVRSLKAERSVSS